MKNFLKVIIFTIIGASSSMFMACEPPPTVTINPDLTTSVVGPYQGNYVVNYEADPQSNFSSQINLVVTRIDKKIIRVDAQGGDSFECSIAGIVTNLTLSNMTNPTGVYTLGTTMEGAFVNDRLYYKVTGISNGEPFSAEFTAIL